MAIQIPNPGTGNGATGDNEFVLWSKVKDNFSDQTNAASRLVGTGARQVPAMGLSYGLEGAGYLGQTTAIRNEDAATVNVRAGFYSFTNTPADSSRAFLAHIHMPYAAAGHAAQFGVDVTSGNAYTRATTTGVWGEQHKLYSSGNTTKDSNGFLKGASPVADLYSDKVELNYDAVAQGGITFAKLAIGDYLVKGSLGFAQEGWYIETPKDANGNVLVAVVYEQLSNKDISIKTYAKKFDDETGDIVANLARPRDIPDGRFISLRLHELPKELPVMPETKTEV